MQGANLHSTVHADRDLLDCTPLLHQEDRRQRRTRLWAVRLLAGRYVALELAEDHQLGTGWKQEALRPGVHENPSRQGRLEVAVRRVVRAVLPDHMTDLLVLGEVIEPLHDIDRSRRLSRHVHSSSLGSQQRIFILYHNISEMGVLY